MTKQIIVVSLTSILLMLSGCKHEKSLFGTTTRPDDFPIDITPPEDAFEVRYESPDTARIGKGTYLMGYMVNEKYPAENMIETIRGKMQAKGYVKVQWSPEDFKVYSVKYESRFKKYVEDPNETELLIKNMRKSGDSSTQWRKPEPVKGKQGWLYCSWSERWITHNDDLVEVLLSYIYREGQDEINELFVRFYIYTPSSMRHDYVQKYKELHPDKFAL